MFHVEENREGAASRTGGTKSDPELSARAQRRRFTAEYKLKILREADACTGRGDVGALLRREGLYSSHLANWRRDRDAETAGLAPPKRGRKPSAAEAQSAEPRNLRNDNARLAARLAQAETVIEVQKKLGAGGALRDRDARWRGQIMEFVDGLASVIGVEPACE